MFINMTDPTHPSNPVQLNVRSLPYQKTLNSDLRIVLLTVNLLEKLDLFLYWGPYPHWVFVLLGLARSN